MMDSLETQPTAPKKKGNNISPYLSTEIRARARSLYVIKGLPPKEIALQLGIAHNTITQLIYRERWTDERRRREQQITLSAERKALTEVEQAMNSWAIQSEVLAEDTFDLARREVAGNSDFQAKNLASLSLAAKNFIGIYRDARGVSATASGPSIGVANFYVANVSSVQSQTEPKNAANVVDI